jgi:O-antigen ligase
MGPVAGLAPLGFAPLLHVTGLATLIAYRIDHQRWPLPRGPVVLPLCLLAAYMALSCLWTTAPSFAWIKLPELTAIAASGLIIPVAIRDLPPGDFTRLQNALLSGLLFGLLISAGDMAAGSPIKSLHWRWASVPVNAYDREIITLGLLLWPAALILYNRNRKWIAVTGLVAYTTGILFLQSHSAMAGMALGLATLGVAARIPILVRRGIVAIDWLGFALCMPVAFLLFRLGADQWPGLQFSFRHRVQIWHFTAGRILQHPLFGLGLEGSRHIPTADLAPGFISLDHDNVPLHPHNVFLQIWLELGIAGVLLTGFFIQRLLQASDAIPPPARAFTLAIAVAFLVIASVAFGIWQGWWMAILALIAPLMMIAGRK